MELRRAVDDQRDVWWTVEVVSQGAGRWGLSKALFHLGSVSRNPWRITCVWLALMEAPRGSDPVVHELQSMAKGHLFGSGGACKGCFVSCSIWLRVEFR